MTQEEKARVYDEALEIARKINSGEGVPAPPDWTVYEVIFPELKESENERIRKEIIKLVEFYYGSSLALKHTVSKDEMVAWLEKQPKPKWTKEDEMALNDALWCCKQASSIAKDENDIGSAWYVETWLKSLKKRLEVEE